MTEHVEPQPEPGAPQRAASGPQPGGTPGAIAGGEPGSTQHDTSVEKHPRGLCGDRACEKCRAIRVAAVAARKAAITPAPWPLPGPIASLDDALVVLDWAARTLDPPRANAIDRLVKSWVKIKNYDAAIRDLELLVAKLSHERK
jgi:hypothetical protein